MDLGDVTYPDGYTEPGEALVERFERLIWHNSEICNNCFQRIRAIGELKEKRTPLGVHEFNAFYERTERGSQEYDPFEPPTSRYGQCYCLDCGADTKANYDQVTRETLVRRAKNICGYIDRETDTAIDGKAMGRALHALKSERDNQGYDSEILAAATCVGLQRADTDTGRRTKAKA